MREFVQKQNHPQQAQPDSIRNFVKGASHLGRQESIDPSPKPLSSPEPTRFDFNFAKIPLFAPSSPPLQAKLKVGEPNDVFEQEAERVADRVVNMQSSGVAVIPNPASQSAVSSVQRKCESCNTTSGAQMTGEEKLQAAHEKLDDCGALEFGGLRTTEDEELDVGGAGTSTAASHADIQATGGGSKPLSTSTRAFMEPRFGFDFSKVKVHTDSEASSLTRNLGARAFTVGQDIFFGNHEYQPESQEGRHLLAHELTHVVQQSQASTSQSIGTLREQRIQRYLVGPPQRIGLTTTTPVAYGNCRNFNTVVSWNTDVRNGHILQECINADTITKCDGTNVPAPNIPHYWEAWEVDATGAISDGNSDTWFRAGKPDTRGRWTFDSNVFAVGALDPAWGFRRNSVVTAGGLLATTTGPSHDELYQPSLVRHHGGQWNCCEGNNTHTPI